MCVHPLVVERCLGHLLVLFWRFISSNFGMFYPLSLPLLPTLYKHLYKHKDDTRNRGYKLMFFTAFNHVGIKFIWILWEYLTSSSSLKCKTPFIFVLCFWYSKKVSKEWKLSIKSNRIYAYTFILLRYFFCIRSHMHVFKGPVLNVTTDWIYP